MEAIRPLATRPAVPERVLDLLLRQKQLQPYLDQPADLFALAGCSRALRAHHPWGSRDRLLGAAYTLEAMVAPAGSGRGSYFLRILGTHDAALHGGCDQLLADCRDMVWMADAWRHGATPHPRRLYLDAERRRVCLAYLYAVTTMGTYDDGLTAVDEARQMDWARLLEVLYMDTTLATSTMVAAGIGVGTLQLSRRAAASSSAAWGTGTALMRAKALALGTGAATGGTFGVLLLGVTAYWGAQMSKKMHAARREVYAGQGGKDAILCEYLTGRRNARGEVVDARRC